MVKNQIENNKPLTASNTQYSNNHLKILKEIATLLGIVGVVIGIAYVIYMAVIFIM